MLDDNLIVLNLIIVGTCLTLIAAGICKPSITENKLLKQPPQPHTEGVKIGGDQITGIPTHLKDDFKKHAYQSTDIVPYKSNSSLRNDFNDFNCYNDFTFETRSFSIVDDKWEYLYIFCQTGGMYLLGIGLLYAVKVYMTEGLVKDITCNMGNAINLLLTFIADIRPNQLNDFLRLVKRMSWKETPRLNKALGYVIQQHGRIQPALREIELSLALLVSFNSRVKDAGYIFFNSNDLRIITTLKYKLTNRNKYMATAYKITKFKRVLEVGDFLLVMSIIPLAAIVNQALAGKSVKFIQLYDLKKGLINRCSLINEWLHQTELDQRLIDHDNRALDIAENITDGILRESFYEALIIDILSYLTSPPYDKDTTIQKTAVRTRDYRSHISKRMDRLFFDRIASLHILLESDKRELQRLKVSQDPSFHSFQQQSIERVSDMCFRINENFFPWN